MRWLGSASSRAHLYVLDATVKGERRQQSLIKVPDCSIVKIAFPSNFSRVKWEFSKLGITTPAVIYELLLDFFLRKHDEAQCALLVKEMQQHNISLNDPRFINRAFDYTTAVNSIASTEQPHAYSKIDWGNMHSIIDHVKTTQQSDPASLGVLYTDIIKNLQGSVIDLLSEISTSNTKPDLEMILRFLIFIASVYVLIFS